MSHTQQKDEKSTEKEVASEKLNNDSINQYQIRPSIGNSFPIASIREIINEILLQTLDGKEYTCSEVGAWCRQIVDGINMRIKSLEIPRYKHIVQTMLAEQTGAGSRYIARCHWDASCDSKVSEQYKSETIICIVTVFGVYQY
ncbi:dynein light chain Tctex-type-like [Contarinia nasturtii]|uniref:dynein light chain Tctex-type-like n=1 Tax=Contarinia nasturtii TaxID=265458 RepID=UPI0012D4231B|nr:dynein light chain Tctex-type-like [Contarinia nasturtii]